MSTGPYETLDRLLSETPLFTLIGCPDWCEWSQRMGAHEHVSDGVAELVVMDAPGTGFPLVLEVRHAAAPVAPTPG